jgi:hypothetical protein
VLVRRDGTRLPDAVADGVPVLSDLTGLPALIRA